MIQNKWRYIDEETKKYGGGYKLFAVIITILLMTIAVSVVKFREGEIDYYNSDATWHTLLTIRAYDETPISDHLFLPIVTLGDEDDKGISWGATLPDDKGNYYYTSFSPAGYFLPWLFLKVVKLPVDEMGLYVFNTFLFSLSAILLIYLLNLIYKGEKCRYLLCLIGGLCYISVPEVLHGMGIVYWHQSLMQVTLLLQIIMFYKYITDNSRISRYLFYILAVLNPYIEWTGYVANVGFALAELIRYWKIDRKRGFLNAVMLGVLTVLSFGLFSVHYLLRVDASAFFDVLKSRFMARNVTTEIALTSVFGSYYRSFMYLWVLLLFLLIYCFVKNGKLELRHGLLFLVFGFLVLENIIMKEHALTYSYDRMKVIFVIILLLCEVVRNVIKTMRNKVAMCLLFLLTGSTVLLNMNSYIKDDSYICRVDYRADNQLLADFILEEYPEAVYASNFLIRGYMNLLFGRGIYEWVDVDQAKKIAAEKGKDEVVFITQDGYKIQNINVYHMNSEVVNQYDVVEHQVRSLNPNAVCVSSFTDVNWMNGIMSNVLLFERDDSLLIQFLTHSRIISNGQHFEILNVDYDSKWIRVTVDRNADICMYPSEILIK